jgi:transposase
MRKRIDDMTKAQIAITAIRGEKTMAEIASKFKVHPNVVAKYKKQAIDNMAMIFSKKADGRVKEMEAKQEELYKHIGEQKVAIDWLKKKCRQLGLI